MKNKKEKKIKRTIKYSKSKDDFISTSIYCPELKYNNGQIGIAWCIYRCARSNHCDVFIQTEINEPEKIEKAKNNTSVTERKVDEIEEIKIKNHIKKKTRKKQGSLGNRAKQLIIEHPKKKNQEIAEMIKKEFNSNTTSICISWYRNKLKKENE